MTPPAARFFDAIAARYDRVYAIPPAATRERMRRVLRELPPAPARVLDLGVGTGRELPALLDAGLAPTGVDASGEMLARCARRARAIPLVQADFWGPLPLPEASFDAVVALHGTLAHAPPPVEASFAALGAELARVTRPGAVFVAEMPSPAWLDRVAAPPGTHGDAGPADPRDAERVVRRTGDRACVFEDRRAGVSIEARLLDDAAWQRALGPAWDARVEPLGVHEQLVVARRTR
jgi:SAM-dependent methyltransferase